MQALNDHIAKDGFRLRGLSMSRIDGFSDVVFGFALTLIVVSIEVPHTYDELHALLLGFVPFSLCFLFLILVWWSHFKFFRRYGLHDFSTVVINSCLLFTLLFYAYPLKFLFSLAIGSSHAKFFSSPYQLRELMEVYGVGFAAVYLCLAALYANAWRQRVALRLNPVEVELTLSGFWEKFGDGGVGLLCALIAHFLPPEHAGDAGWFFFLISLSSLVNGIIFGRRVRRARARTAPRDLLPLSHTS